MSPAPKVNLLELSKDTPCPRCGAPSRNIDFELDEGRFVGNGWRLHCAECEVIVRAEKAKEETERRYRVLSSVWESVCPPLYRSTDLDKIPCSRAVIEKVLSWKMNPKGLLLHGPTRSGKTRLMFKLLESIHYQDEVRPKAMSSGDFTHQVGRTFGRGDGEGERFIENLCDDSLLFIDDVGKGRMTDRVESEFFHVIETRAAHLRPTMLTTNLTAATMQSMGSIDRAEPLIARLREFFEEICVEPNGR